MTLYKTEENFSKHLTNDDLLRYYRLLLSENEHRIIDSHLKQCEFCSDALKGVKEMDNAIHIHTIVYELRKRMKKRLKSKQPIFSKFYILSLLLVFFIIGLILFLAFYFIIVKR